MPESDLAADISAALPEVSAAVAEVTTLASELIRIDTTNPGDPCVMGRERAAAEYVAAKLTDAGYDPVYLESGAPGRGNVIIRVAGADPSRPALLLHGHLDVVPADPAEWSVHPFSGEVSGGYVWGRGAVDMKGAVAVMLAVARQMRRHGVVPPRDLVFAFVADEEAGSAVGARWLVEHRRDLFDGVTEAIGEVGGFSVTVGGRRAYLVQTAEKGVMRLALTAHGTAGHASMINPDNAIARLAAAVARLHEHRFPLILTDPARELLTGLAALAGVDFDPRNPQDTVARLGPMSRMIGAALRDTAQVTMIHGGYKANVVPSLATAKVNGRVLPGREEAFLAEVRSVLGPGIEVEPDLLPPVQTGFGGPLVAAMAEAVGQEDPGAVLLPYLLPAATDAKSFARIGIRHYGFTPLRLPADLDFSALFHGADERVPVAALEFGVRVLSRLLRTC